MPTRNSLKIDEKSKVTTFYFPVTCRYNQLKFRLIISNQTIIHLSFSEAAHLQALVDLKRLMPGAKFAKPDDGIDLAGNLVQRILVPGEEMPAPDFVVNPFLKNGTGFQQRIWRLISGIRRGETRTYGELASAANIPGGARAVGHACNQNPLAIIIPCHRVVAAKGPGGFAGGD